MEIPRWPAGGMRHHLSQRHCPALRVARALPGFSFSLFSFSISKATPVTAAAWEEHSSLLESVNGKGSQLSSVYPPPPPSATFAWRFAFEVLEAQTVIVSNNFEAEVVLGSHRNQTRSLAHTIFKTKLSQPCKTFGHLPSKSRFGLLLKN